MTQSTFIDIRRGWKVFAKSEEIGEVVRIGSRDIEVQKGMLTNHTYRVPREHIAEASDGIVDLAIDRERAEEYAVGRLNDGDPRRRYPASSPRSTAGWSTAATARLSPLISPSFRASAAERRPMTC